MDGINRNLYIPLYGKAKVPKMGIIFNDKSAEEIWAFRRCIVFGVAIQIERCHRMFADILELTCKYLAIYSSEAVSWARRF